MAIAVSVFVVVVSILVFMHQSKPKQVKNIVELYPTPTADDIPSAILDQFPDKQRWRLQTRVANARSASDLLNIFAEFQDLQNLSLPTIIDATTELHVAKEQAFRDLVRERVVVNDTPVEPGTSPSSDPSQFKRDFEAHIQEAIMRHVSDPIRRKNISMHICCHLSRTRAGGDSLFAVQDIFKSPQVSDVQHTIVYSTCIILSSKVYVYSLSVLSVHSWS